MQVFLGSSSEPLDHLGEIAMWLEGAGLEPLPWNGPALFLPGENTFLKLIEISKAVDAAVFIFAEDDKAWYREDTASQPRDKVLLEYGLFVGALGPKRAIICRRGQAKAATDLQEINWIDSSPKMTHRAKVQLKGGHRNWHQSADLRISRRTRHPPALQSVPLQASSADSGIRMFLSISECLRA
jgi:predicted nucleotide-binding protein